MADEVVEFIDPDGDVTALEVEYQASGRFMPPVAMHEDEIPGQSGARLRHVKHDVREVALPVWLTASDDSALRTKLRTLIRAMDPARGEGTLRVTSPLGDTRELRCRLSQGLGLEESYGNTAAPGLQRAVLAFRAHDPYWYDKDPAAVTYTTGTQTKFFPFFPLTVNGDNIFGEQTVDNTGDVEAWPIWKVEGPGSAIVLENKTTGKKVDLPITLLVGESVTIDARPFRKTVKKSDGSNLFGSLTTDSELWALPRGLSTVTIQMADATADSYVSLNYSRRWLAP